MKHTIILLLLLTFTGIAEAQQEISKDELMGKFNPATHQGFVKLEKKYTNKPDLYLRKEVAEVLKKMADAALRDGVKLIVISGTRNFDYQKGIWDRKWSRTAFKELTEQEKVREIMRYSAMPGASRHHWGTDIDFNSVEIAYFNSSEGQKMYAWLCQHAREFGFIQPYSAKDSGRTGYEEEKWHWSYAPLSRDFLKQYDLKVSYQDFVGFSGCTSAGLAKVIEDYVNGVDASALPSR
jgi:LAS superfamily LD-carboxypeptidase LdcB